MVLLGLGEIACGETRMRTGGGLGWSSVEGAELGKGDGREEWPGNLAQVGAIAGVVSLQPVGELL